MPRQAHQDSSAAPFTTAQVEWLTERDDHLWKQHRGWFSRKFKDQRNRALAGFLILLVGVGYALGQTVSEGQLYDAQINACERVNVLRAQSNLSDLVSFNILSVSTQREYALANQIKSNKKAYTTHKSSADLLADQARELRVTKLTDCSKAVNHPKGYHFPLAGPIGEPTTGKLNPDVVHIIAGSQATVVENKGGG